MKELSLDATVDNIAVVTDFVNAELEAIGCPMKAQMQIDVAIDELFSNSALYAYAPGSGSATVRVETELDPPAAIITFIDRGVPFDPLSACTPDVSLPACERDAGGLGVFLVKKIMDEVAYAYRDGENIIRIKKRL